MNQLCLSSAVLASALLLGACSNTEQTSGQNAEMDVADAAAPQTKAITSDAIRANNAQIPVSIPQIAYSYNYGFRLPAADIPSVQQAHIALCEKKGPQLCHILNMAQSGSEGDYAQASLQLEIAAPNARLFGAELVKAAKAEGGEQIAASIEGEDLSKQIVDTAARLRSRALLRDRLMEVLATRKGSVEELVAAERSVTEVNEEIDQATSWLAEMKGRVSFSKVMINYESGARTAGSFWKPIADALSNIGTIMGTVIAMIITLLVGILPFAVLGWLGFLLYRRFRKHAVSTQAHETQASEE